MSTNLLSTPRTNFFEPNDKSFELLERYLWFIRSSHLHESKETYFIRRLGLLAKSINLSSTTIIMSIQIKLLPLPTLSKSSISQRETKLPFWNPFSKQKMLCEFKKPFQHRIYRSREELTTALDVLSITELLWWKTWSRCVSEISDKISSKIYSEQTEFITCQRFRYENKARIY